MLTKSIDHLEKVRYIVFALRCAKVTSKDEVVKALVSDDPESVEVRKQRDIQEPVVDDSIDMLMMLQEIIFIYPDDDECVNDFKVVWDTWKRLDNRTDPARFAPTREHINLFAEFLMEHYVRNGVILGIVCPTNPSVIAKRKWFLDNHPHLEISFGRLL